MMTRKKGESDAEPYQVFGLDQIALCDMQVAGKVQIMAAPQEKAQQLHT